MSGAGMSTFEVDQPWIVYHYGLTHDKWWPPHNSTRILGRARIKMECAICGETRIADMKIPRFGTVSAPGGGRHPQRLRFCLDHLHPDRPHPMSWVRPLLNPDAHKGGIELDLLAMRLETELNDGAAP